MDNLVYGLGLLTLAVLGIFFFERAGPVLLEVDSIRSRGVDGGTDLGGSL